MVFRSLLPGSSLGLLFSLHSLGLVLSDLGLPSLFLAPGFRLGKFLPLLSMFLTLVGFLLTNVLTMATVADAAGVSMFCQPVQFLVAELGQDSLAFLV